jgi:hypothetical protein
MARQMRDQVEALIQRQGAPNLYWALAVVPVPLVDPRTNLGDWLELPEVMWPGLKRFEQGPLTQAELEAELAKGREELRPLKEVAARVRHVLKLAQPTDDTVANTKLVAESYPVAKRALIAEGLRREQVDAMPQFQVVALHALREYRRTAQELAKWSYVRNGWQHPGYDEARRKCGSAFKSLDAICFQGTAQSFDFGLSSQGTNVSAERLDRDMAALRVVEAVRMHAAVNGGRPPACLAAITTVPVPNDPFTDQLFLYRVDGGKASLWTAQLSMDPGKTVGQLHYELILQAKSRQ